MYQDWMPSQFRSRLRIEGDCWVWTGGRAPFGHGRVYLPGQTRRPMAHKMSWEAINGPVPRGQCVLHKCDNPPCVRPSHLFLGTKAENNADRDAKGRTAKGPDPTKGHPNETNPNHKLTDQQVSEIRKRYKPRQYGLVRDLCNEYQVSKRHLFNIINETSRSTK